MKPASPRESHPQRGSVLIIVLWIAFGLVALALYFAQTMQFELRASDNRTASAEASQAISGALRYASNVLTTVEMPGALPDPLEYESEALPIGDAHVWFIGRELLTGVPGEPWFGFADEAAKLNLNTATAAMLELLPRMTPQLAAAIIDWRDTDSTVTTGGAEDETYQAGTPAYRCKNAPFESVDELRLVSGTSLELLLGEDTNRNGVLDPNENDGDNSLPADNRDGRLDPGLLEYVTVYTQEPNTRLDGTPRLSINSTNQQELASYLQEKLGVEQANQVLAQVGAQPNFRSLLEFYLRVRSQISATEFAEIEGDLTISTNSVLEGLVNVNTASEAVLACIPGIGIENAPAVIAARQKDAARTHSVAWVADALPEAAAIQAGPYLTGFSFQHSIDIAALGHHGRGYQRVRFVLDTTQGGIPRIVARQDLTHLGWALGRELREDLTRARTSGEPPFSRNRNLSLNRQR